MVSVLVAYSIMLLYVFKFVCIHAAIDYYRRKKSISNPESEPAKLRRSTFSVNPDLAATTDLSKKDREAISQKAAQQEEDSNLTDLEILKRNLQRIIDSM
jgi:hypothetical protein